MPRQCCHALIYSRARLLRPLIVPLLFSLSSAAGRPDTL